MGVKLGLVVVAFFFMACGESFNPEKVTPGMSTDSLVGVVGEPEEKLPLMDGYEFWRYKDDHVVLVGEGRVINVGVMSPEEYKRTMQKMDRTMDLYPDQGLIKYRFSLA